MSKELKVSVLIPCRDGESSLQTTVESILNQTVDTFVAVADDASVDDTPKILKKLSGTGRVLSVRYHKREPRNYARVPVLLNMLLNVLPPADFYMISGDDCVYPLDYLEKLITFMRNDKVDLASGCHDIKNFSHLTLPSGSGRLISVKLFKKITPLPNSIGWESWMIYKTQSLGRKVAVYSVQYEHRREYSFGSTRTFGYSAYVNGVPFIFTLFRALKSMFSGLHNPINSISIPLGQLEYMIKGATKLDCASFVNNMYKWRIKQSIIGVLYGRH